MASLDIQPRCLLIGIGGRLELQPLLDRLRDRSVAVLVKPEEAGDWRDYPVIEVRFRDDVRDRHFRRACLDAEFLAELKSNFFDSVIVPSIIPTTWRDNAIESLAAEISNTVELASRDASTIRSYQGENLHRLIYNKAYLTSMLQLVPDPRTFARVLEVGCSDGLACDLMLQLGATEVHGVDLWTEGIDPQFSNAKTVFSRSDATRLHYPDQYFDLSYSIATFEHMQEPWAVLEEMHRVTKVGGYMYIQAGPLFNSPFGHHMFPYFADCPWAHLRHSPRTLAAMIRDSGKSEELLAQTGLSPEDYVAHMLSKEHINGLTLADYQLEKFAAEHNGKILKYSASYEGKELLTHEIRKTLAAHEENVLVEHGFEFCLIRQS